MFCGSEHSNLRPTNPEYVVVGSLGNLYQLMLVCWRRETCAPRMQEKWSEANPTCGQCSITAFLVQDIFGGEVYGVPLGDGNYHCFNVVGDAVFDLTSEQFDHPLAYTMDYALCDQLRRAVVSIPSNIAEGNGRDSKAEYTRFLSIARGSVFEVRTQLELAARFGYIQLSPTMTDTIDRISKMLYSLMKRLRA